MSRFTLALLVLLSSFLRPAQLPAQQEDRQVALQQQQLLLMQPPSTIVLQNGQSISAHISKVENDSITFFHADARRNLGQLHRPVMTLPRRQIRQVRVGADGFSGTGTLGGILIGTVVGLASKASLDEKHKGEFLGRGPGFLALFGALVVGIAAGIIIDLSSSTPDIVLHPAQLRDYQLIQAHVGRMNSIDRAQSTSQQVWSLALAKSPRLVIATTDATEHDCYLVGLSDDGVLVMRHEWFASNSSGNEAEYHLRFEDILTITYAPPGIFGGKGWTWKPGTNSPDALRPHALSSTYRNVLVYAPVQPGTASP
jgi:hypothetical protein